MPIPPPVRAGWRSRARTSRRDEYLSLSAYFRAPISGCRRRVTQIRMFLALRPMSISARCISIYVYTYSAFRELGATGRRPRPRIFLTTPSTGGGVRRRAYCDPAAEIESSSQAASSSHRLAFRANCKGRGLSGARSRRAA